MVSVSRWNSAVINQQFLTYNFRPKTEWPTEAAAGAATATSLRLVETTSLDDFQLPPKSLFPAAMPRYPNVWFYVDASLADSYDAAVRLVADQLRGPMRLHESHGPLVNPEGADFEAGLEHLRPWEVAEHPMLQHAHAFHMRYYHSALAAHRLERVALRTRAGDRPSIAWPRAHTTKWSTPTRITPTSRCVPSAAVRVSTPICVGTWSNWSTIRSASNC
jgi:hypothetical protein